MPPAYCNRKVLEPCGFPETPESQHSIRIAKKKQTKKAAFPSSCDLTPVLKHKVPMQSISAVLSGQN